MLLGISVGALTQEQLEANSIAGVTEDLGPVTTVTVGRGLLRRRGWRGGHRGGNAPHGLAPGFIQVPWRWHGKSSLAAGHDLPAQRERGGQVCQHRPPGYPCRGVGPERRGGHIRGLCYRCPPNDATAGMTKTCYNSLRQRRRGGQCRFFWRMAETVHGGLPQGLCASHRDFGSTTVRGAASRPDDTRAVHEGLAFDGHGEGSRLLGLRLGSVGVPPCPPVLGGRPGAVSLGQIVDRCLEDDAADAAAVRRLAGAGLCHRAAKAGPCAWSIQRGLQRSSPA